MLAATQKCGLGGLHFSRPARRRIGAARIGAIRCSVRCPIPDAILDCRSMHTRRCCFVPKHGLSFLDFLLCRCGCFCRGQMGHLAYHLGLSRYLPEGQNFCGEARSASFLHPYSAGKSIASPNPDRALFAGSHTKVRPWRPALFAPCQAADWCC